MTVSDSLATHSSFVDNLEFACVAIFAQKPSDGGNAIMTHIHKPTRALAAFAAPVPSLAVVSGNQRGNQHSLLLVPLDQVVSHKK
jgi:hypothetical protein